MKHTYYILSLLLINLVACGGGSPSAPQPELGTPTLPADLNAHLINITHNKNGLEIGGPSGTAKLIYKHVDSLDNLVSSQSTAWAEHTDTYKFAENKTGKVIINDATDLTAVQDASYDFVFASHVLEHIANPIKALLEWKRAIIPGGYIILILPNKEFTFDHKRNITPFSTILAQYEKGAGEDDLPSLDEILALHDLSMDPPAGTLEQFKARSLKNIENRCLHHFVYSPELLDKIRVYIGGKFIRTFTDGINIWYIFQKI